MEEAPTEGGNQETAGGMVGEGPDGVVEQGWGEARVGHADEAARGADPESAVGGEVERVDGGAGEAVFGGEGAEGGALPMEQAAAVGAEPERAVGSCGLTKNDGGKPVEVTKRGRRGEANTVEAEEARVGADVERPVGRLRNGEGTAGEALFLRPGGEVELGEAFWFGGLTVSGKQQGETKREEARARQHNYRSGCGQAWGGVCSWHSWVDWRAVRSISSRAQWPPLGRGWWCWQVLQMPKVRAPEAATMARRAASSEDSSVG